MSVLIKGMVMPKNCFQCQIKKGCDNAWYLDTENRPDNCPLVEVPTPHGDLIDRQKLLEDNKHLEYPTNEKYRRDRAWAVGFNSGARHCNEHAVYAKTVIKAEDEE